ncbi:MAG: M3 family oligoendopeptidase [Phycisphaerae bacterium]
MPQEEFPRRFVDPKDVLDRWEAIEPYFDSLRDADCSTVEALTQWLERYSELVACIEEVGTDRHVKMTCQTDDPERKAAFLDFLENIDPKCKPRYQELDTKYASSEAARALPQDRYGVLDRAIRARVAVFREENVTLQTEEAKLAQMYQEIGGAQTVMFDGKEQTMQMLSLYADDVDRSVREAAWVKETERRLQDVERLEDIFDKLVDLRHRMALNADCKNFQEYAFLAKQRFDYTPEDCFAFHDAVERAVVPVARGLLKKRAAALGVDPLRPWDGSVDVRGRPPLRPFKTAEELCDSTSRLFHRIHPELGAQFDEMRKHAYLDLQSRKGKAPGGYQATYDESRHPFIFMNAVGTQRDVRTLIHEGGHAFHCFAARHDPIVAYRSSPIEFAEVASFGMEMLSLDYLDEFYDGEDLARARRSQLEGIISLFPWVATIDAFQHSVYTAPEHDHDQRRAWWLELHERFGGIADYTGYEEALAYNWQRQLHLYEVPFYYIEYGIAKLGALQVWRNAKRDRSQAVERYRAALALGGSRPLPELFQAAGARFDFSYETLAPLMELVSEELEKLPQ